MASRTEANLGHIAGSSIAETPLPYKQNTRTRLYNWSLDKVKMIMMMTIEPFLPARKVFFRGDGSKTEYDGSWNTTERKLKEY